MWELLYSVRACRGARALELESGMTARWQLPEGKQLHTRDTLHGPWRALWRPTRRRPDMAEADAAVALIESHRCGSACSRAPRLPTSAQTNPKRIPRQQRGPPKPFHPPPPRRVAGPSSARAYGMLSGVTWASGFSGFSGFGGFGCPLTLGLGGGLEDRRWDARQVDAQQDDGHQVADTAWFQMSLEGSVLESDLPAEEPLEGCDWQEDEVDGERGREVVCDLVSETAGEDGVHHDLVKV